MVVDQLGILLTGVIAVWLTQQKRESWRRWACIFGLLGQPFWFFAAWKAEQWGILAISTLYTYAWTRGIWTYWLAPEHYRQLLRAAWRQVLPCSGLIRSRELVTLRNVLQRAQVALNVPCGVMNGAQFFKGSQRLVDLRSTGAQ